MKRLLFIAAALTAVLLCASTAFAAEEELGTSQQTWYLDMWHYSGGYWQIGNAGSNKITISDSEMAAKGGIVDYLEAGNSINFSVPLPSAAQQAMAEGKEVKWRLKARSVSLSKLYELNSLKTESMDQSELVFSVRPRFNLVRDITLGDYVAGLRKTVPLVDQTYGHNIFSIYGNGASAVQGYGAFSSKRPDSVISPYIHPSMITGASGALAGGYSILLSDDVLPSDGYQIGQGTFASAGACGLQFIFPIDVVFYTEVEDPPDPGGDPQDPEPDPDDPIDPQIPADDVYVDARLELPPWTYVGHRVIAQDLSEITIGDEVYGAARAYGQKKASPSLKIVQSGVGTAKKITSTETALTFSQEGDFDVRLKVTASGVSDTDTQTIEVRPTPYVEADVGGRQKQNRKQTLFIAAAQNASYPVTSLDIKMTDIESGEEISTSWNFDGEQPAIQNSLNIKCRKPYDNGSDQYFLKIRMDFLSKFGTEREFEYRVTARDSKGDSMTAVNRFTVVPDAPPDARIELEPALIRGEGSNVATVPVDDVSLSDGDQLNRSWSWSENGLDFSDMPGFTDLSFGSLQNIKFQKTGVGPFWVRLRVKDMWPDETLEEYISDEDYLEAETEEQSEVINVAPQVSLEVTSVKTAEILLLAGNDEELEEASAAKTEIRKELLAEGISAEIKVEDVSDAQGQAAVIRKLGELSTDYGFQGPMNGFWEKGTASADEKRIYKAEALWPAGEDMYDCYPTQPFTIRAYDKKTLAELWSFTVGENLLTAADRGKSAYYGHDGEDKYLYFVVGGRTLLLDKETGALAAQIPFEFGCCSALNDEYIYTFKPDGIYKISRGDGSVSRLIAETIYADDRQVSRLGGKYSFLCKRGTEHLKGTFDPRSEKLSYTRLSGTSDDSGESVTTLLGIDTDGKTVIFTKNGTASAGCARVFGEDGSLVKTVNIDPRSGRVYPVADASGRICGAAAAYNSRYREDYNVTTEYYDFESDAAQASATITGNDYMTDIDRQMIGIKRPNGSVTVGLGADYDFVYSLGTPYPERFTLFNFNKGSADTAAGSTLAAGTPANAEYAYQVPGTLLLTTAYNLPAAPYNTTGVYSVSESLEGKTERLKKQELSYETDFSFALGVDSGLDPRGFASQITDRVSEGEKSLVIMGNAADSSAKKQYRLLPDTTYYYEYDTSAGRDILSAEAKLSKDGPAISGYEVSEVYTEDFNDSELSPFFTYSSGTVVNARYNMVDVRQLQGTQIKYGQIDFTVPEGTVGVYSFNYRTATGGSSHTSVHFELSKDGGDYETKDEGIDGLFYGKEPLLPGRYSIRGVVQGYAQSGTNQRITASIDIDNMRVTLFKAADTYPAAGIRTLRSESHSSGLGGETHISGSFTTPKNVLSYGRFDGTHQAAEINSAGNAGWTFTVPDGSFAPYFTAGLRSNPGMSYSGSREIPRNITWTLSGDGGTEKTWTATVSTKAPDYFGTIDRDATVRAYGLTGTNTLKANHVYNVSSFINSAEYYYTDPGTETGQALTDGRFFTDGGDLFYEDIVYDGTTDLCLNTGEGSTTVSNLKIYTIQNGTRIYAENSSFHAESAARDWQANNATVTVASTAKELEEEPAKVFKKGEYVNQKFFYSDYENDPSKASYYKYTHIPLNDGLHPQSGQVLTETINRFYVDGKYLLQHWQYDSTGKEPYDLQSNVAEFVFYILGEPVGSAPWVEYIATDPPSDIYDGDPWSAELEINDLDKDPLDLTVEIYHSSDKAHPVYIYTKNDIRVGISGRYPVIRFPFPGTAKEGTYDIIATVSDGTGAGMKNYRFVVKTAKSLKGAVTHTDSWETNRNAFNYKWFDRTADEPAGSSGWLKGSAAEISEKRKTETAAELYSRSATPRLRYANVFWPGEQLELRTSIGGNAIRVTAELLSADGLKKVKPEGSSEFIDLSDYTTALAYAGAGDLPGEKAWTGTLWNTGMRTDLLTARPLPLIVRFTARYSDGKTLIFEVPVIFDFDIGYSRLHRVY
ncbi:MAG: hypothetical protein IKR93_06935 [Firmicutes bacterium]|nr:hypothetical protein [Bacillota bacterium]